jgi:hypothetical protein
MYAERSLGEMKERHAALGGAAVTIKGSVASSLPKPAKSLPAEEPVKKGAKTKTPAAGTPPPASQVAAAAQTPTPASARPRVPARPPMPESTFVQNLDGTYSMVDAATAAGMGADPRASMNVPANQLPANTDPRAMWVVPREVAYGDRRYGSPTRDKRRPRRRIDLRPFPNGAAYRRERRVHCLRSLSPG